VQGYAPRRGQCRAAAGGRGQGARTGHSERGAHVGSVWRERAIAVLGDEPHLRGHGDVVYQAVALDTGARVGLHWPQAQMDVGRAGPLHLTHDEAALLVIVKPPRRGHPGHPRTVRVIHVPEGGWRLRLARWSALRLLSAISRARRRGHLVGSAGAGHPHLLEQLPARERFERAQAAMVGRGVRIHRRSPSAGAALARWTLTAGAPRLTACSQPFRAT